MAKKEKAKDLYNGLLIVDKPGRTPDHSSPHSQTTQEHNSALEQDFPTSHDVVQLVRRWSKQRRIGHTGTLDPLASGVLILCLGPSTRLVEYYQGHAKQYYAEIVLGRSTDTYDAFGKVLEESHIPPLTTEHIEATLEQFRGTIQQKPPIFSALKQAGESLHRKARRGEAVEVKSRTVTFHALDLVNFETPNRIILRCTCSAGTYIRSLAHDLGKALGSVAYLDILRREAAGPFTLADSVSLSDLKSAAENNILAQFLQPPGARLDLPEIKLTNELVTRFGYGQKVVLELPDSWMHDSAFLAQVKAIDTTADEVPNHQNSKPILAKGVDKNGTFLGILSCLGYAKGDRIDSDDTVGSNDKAQSIATVWKAAKWFAT